MSDEVRVAGAFALSLVTVLLTTPLAIRLAVRTGFYDHPDGYKAHVTPTPYLGGVAIMLGIGAAAAIFADGAGRFGPILGCALALWLLGTLDDRSSLGASPRILAEAAAALVLWSADLGWSVFSSEALNLILTVVWVVGIANAFNFMDNIDGAVGTVAGACAMGAGTLALIRDDAVLAALAFSAAGACLGFLRYNLASPSRIFLGDGGSLPIGFVVASVIMTIPISGDLGIPLGVMLSAVLLVGLPVLDTTLVLVSRRRRGVHPLTGGVDHLTHRLRARLPSVQALALVLLAGQGALCAAGIAVLQLPRATIYAAAVGCVGLWALAITVLEMMSWAPAGTGPVPAPQTGGAGVSALGAQRSEQD